MFVRRNLNDDNGIIYNKWVMIGTMRMKGKSNDSDVQVRESSLV